MLIIDAPNIDGAIISIVTAVLCVGLTVTIVSLFTALIGAAWES